MGHPMVMRLPHDGRDVCVHSYRPRCDWHDCFNIVRWEVTPRRYIPDLDVPGDHFCTAHARAIIKRIEKAAAKRWRDRHRTSPPAPARPGRSEDER